MKFAVWLSVFLALVGGNYYAFELGYYHFLLSADKSYLSWLNLVVFFVMYTRLGVYLFNYGKLSEEQSDPGYEAAEYCMAIGMLGTVIGFIMMTYSMTNIDFSNIENIKKLFEVSTKGMSTALFTTAVGLITSVSLRLAHYLAGR